MNNLIPQLTEHKTKNILNNTLKTAINIKQINIIKFLIFFYFITYYNIFNYNLLEKKQN